MPLSAHRLDLSVHLVSAFRPRYFGDSYINVTENACIQPLTRNLFLRSRILNVRKCKTSHYKEQSDRINILSPRDKVCFK